MTPRPRVLAVLMTAAMCVSGGSASWARQFSEASDNAGGKSGSPPTQTQEQVSLVKRYGLEESKVPVRERAGWTPPRKVLVWNRTPQLLSTLAVGRARGRADPGSEPGGGGQAGG